MSCFFACSRSTENQIRFVITHSRNQTPQKVVSCESKETKRRKREAKVELTCWNSALKNLSIAIQVSVSTNWFCILTNIRQISQDLGSFCSHLKKYKEKAVYTKWCFCVPFPWWQCLLMLLHWLFTVILSHQYQAPTILLVLSYRCRRSSTVLCNMTANEACFT